MKTIEDHVPMLADDYGGPTIRCEVKDCLAGRYDWWPVHAQLLDQAGLRVLIALAKPKPVADANGDVHCMRLWPVAECQYVVTDTFGHGHYGGCNPR